MYAKKKKGGIASNYTCFSEIKNKKQKMKPFILENVPISTKLTNCGVVLAELKETVFV